MKAQEKIVPRLLVKSQRIKKCSRRRCLCFVHKALPSVQRQSRGVVLLDVQEDFSSLLPREGKRGL